MGLSQGQKAMYALGQCQQAPITAGFIGAGKVGFSLGKYLRDNGVSLSGYYSRNAASSQEAAEFTQTKSYSSPELLLQDSTVIFLTVPDKAIQQVYQDLSHLPIAGKCLGHCSGSLSSRVFAGARERGARACSLHPICAISHKHTGHESLRTAFFTIEGEDVEDIAAIIRQCGNQIESIPAEKKVLYHSAAVIASNLVVGLYHNATAILSDCGLSGEFSRQALLPLFTGNARNIERQGAVAALTGPVERGDATTVADHLRSFSGQQRELYRLLSCQVLELARQKNPSRDYSATERLLTEAAVVCTNKVSDTPDKEDLL